MKNLKYLLVFSVPFLSSCAMVSPFAGGLAGTDAEYILVSGNRKTGEYELVAKGLNQSKSTETVATTFKDLATIRGMTKFGTEVVSDGGVISDLSD